MLQNVIILGSTNMMPKPVNRKQFNSLRCIQNTRKLFAGVILLIMAGYLLFDIGHGISNVVHDKEPINLQVGGEGSGFIRVNDFTFPRKSKCNYSVGATIINRNQTYDATNVTIQFRFSSPHSSTPSIYVSKRLPFIAATQTTALAFQALLACGQSLVDVRVTTVKWAGLKTSYGGAPNLVLSSEKNMVMNTSQACFKNEGSALINNAKAVLIFYQNNTKIVGGTTESIPKLGIGSSSCITFHGVDTPLQNISNSVIYLQLPLPNNL